MEEPFLVLWPADGKDHADPLILAGFRFMILWTACVVPDLCSRSSSYPQAPGRRGLLSITLPQFLDSTALSHFSRIDARSSSLSTIFIGVASSMEPFLLRRSATNNFPASRFLQRFVESFHADPRRRST